jgi:hypothetical protein
MLVFYASINKNPSNPWLNRLGSGLRYSVLKVMKRCPKCNRVFRDESVRFCRDDGTKLEATSDTLDFDEAPTLRLAPGDLSGRAGFDHSTSSRAN